MKIKYVLIIMAFVSCTSFAQEVLTNVTWNIGLPVAKMNEYTTDVTYRGFTLGGRRFFDKENSLGLMAGWNVFDEKTYDPINVQQGNGSGTISGTQIRSVNIFPILAGFHHYWGNKKDMRAFLGVNVGTYYILQRLDIGVFRFDNDNWHFGFAPEAGLIIPIEGQTGFYAGARYNYALDSGEALGGAEDNYYSYWEINLGFTFSSMWF